jgi:cyclomaltodextrinase
MTGGAPVGTSGTGVFDELGGDVWAWGKRIAGTCAGLPSDVMISLQINGERFPVDRDGDRFSAYVPLQEGDNSVVAVFAYPDGHKERSQGVAYRVPLAPRPTARIQVRVEGNKVLLEATDSTPSEADCAPIIRYFWSAMERNPMPLEIRDADNPTEKPHEAVQAPRAMVTAPDKDGEYYLSLRVVDQAGREDVSTVYFVVVDGAAQAVDFATENARWIEDAVVYGAVPRNFGTTGLQAVTDRLDNLRDLGVRAIWLSPTYPTLEENFGYKVVDYFGVRPDYGDKDDLRTLVEQAHARDIRVLMDFVPNHTSEKHCYAEHARAHGPASPYYDFYDRDEDGNITYYFKWVYLPNLNYDNPEVERFMLDAFSYWVREFDVDGFRVDVAWGIKQRKPDFWPMWRREMKRIKPDLLLLAEAGSRDPYYVANGFDAAYDWTDELGHWAWEDVFTEQTGIAARLRNALTDGGAGYPPDSLVFRFLNNNDTGSRFITTHGVDVYRVALATLLTLPGLPCLFTGDEVGAEFLPYEDKGPIDWSDPYGLREYVRHLIALRTENPSLYSREWELLETKSVDLLAYLRHGGSSDSPILVLVNYSATAVEAELSPVEGFAAGPKMTDLLINELIPTTGPHALKIPMPAWSARILRGGEA